MLQDEITNKRLDVLVDFIEDILIAAKVDEEMPQLESEEQAPQRQKGQGLKIMTPKQLMARLPILLSQVKVGNNSQKLKSEIQDLKNEIRQIIYSLYRSKNLSKTIYNHLINSM